MLATGQRAPARVRKQTARVGVTRYLPCCSSQAIGHTQPQGQRTIIGNAGHAQLATARFIHDCPARRTHYCGRPASPVTIPHDWRSRWPQVVQRLRHQHRFDPKHSLTRPAADPRPPVPPAGLSDWLGGAASDERHHATDPAPRLRNLPFPWSNSPLQTVHPQPLQPPAPPTPCLPSTPAPC